MKKDTNVLSSVKITEFKNKFLQQKALLLSPKERSLVEDNLADEVDIAQSLIIKEMVEKLSFREKENFERINNALKRIDDGTFGFCEECEEPIAEGRLQAIPHSTTCISCAEYNENMIKQYRQS